MKAIAYITLLLLTLPSCDTSSSEKEKQQLKIENDSLQEENKLLKEKSSERENRNRDSTNLSDNLALSQKISWLGKWTFEDNAPVEYILTIGGKGKSPKPCNYKATGIQTFYDLNCRGVDKGDSFELYYLGINDGAFYQADRIDRDKPLLTLKQVNGKILTYWNQLINNYVEEGNHTGQVCFQKE